MVVDAKELMVAIVRSLRDDGAIATIRKAVSRLTGQPHVVDDFDTRHGTDTSRIMPAWNFSVASANLRFAVRYQTVPEKDIIAAVRALDIDPTKFTFVDLGSGKGKALLVAASMGFNKVVGVEFVPKLTEIARSNLAKLRIRNATLVQGDAAEFQFPTEPLVVYLYNPFGPPVMRHILRRLEGMRDREIYVIYFEPKCGDLFDASEVFVRMPTPRGTAATWYTRRE